MKQEKTGLELKKKLIIAIIALSIAFVSAIGAIIAVYAASTQGFQSSFNVNYDVGSNIAVKITSSYQYEGQDPLDMGTIQYDADGTKTGEMETPSIILDANQQSVRFIYQFENIGSNDIYIAAKWSDLAIDINNKTTNAIKNVYVNVNSYNSLSIPTNFNKDKIVRIIESVLVGGIAIAADQTYVVVVTIAIADINKSAFAASDNEGGLEFIIANHNLYNGGGND